MSYCEHSKASSAAASSAAASSESGKSEKLTHFIKFCEECVLEISDLDPTEDSNNIMQVYQKYYVDIYDVQGRIDFFVYLATLAGRGRLYESCSCDGGQHELKDFEIFVDIAYLETGMSEDVLSCAHPLA